MTENRDTLKGHFTKNAIPTEANFAALIDAQLNQAEDGIFKDPNEPLSLRPSGVLPALRLHPSDAISASGHWSLYLTAPVSGATPNLNIADDANNTHLFFNASSRYVGVGTATPTVKLEVAGTIRTSTLGVGVTPVGGLALHVNGNTGLTGNLGVGTTTPSERLDVAGKIKASNGATLTGLTTTTTLGVGVASNAENMHMHVAGNAHVTNYLGVGVATASPTVALEVNGSTKTTNIEVTNYLEVANYAHVANNLSVGINAVLPGTKLYVTGKTYTQGLEVFGNAYATARLSVGIDPADASVTQPLHVAGGAEFRKSSENQISLKSDTGHAILRLIPGDNREPNIQFFTNAAATSGMYVKAEPGLVNGLSGTLLSVGHIAGASCKLNVYGEVEASWLRAGLGNFSSSLSAYAITSSTNVIASGKLYVGSWNLSVVGNALVISYGSTKYAALGIAAGVHRFEVQGTTNYFYVAENGTYGSAAGAAPLLV
jgi:hypothetical protein